MKRVIPFTPSWKQKAYEEAVNFAPPIRPCVECGNPVVSGYCCNFCGSVDPSGTPEQRQEFRDWVAAQKAKGKQAES